MHNPLVSIIIPVYNAEKYLAECIESAINQTWLHKEIIIIDDGSVDNSLKIAWQYECDWIKVFHQKNKGASAARNKGIQESKGAFIQFLDADDLLDKNKIAYQATQLMNAPDCVAVGATLHFFDSENPYEKLDDFGKDDLIDPVRFLVRLYGGHLVEPGYEGMIQPNAWLSPRTIIEKAGYWNEQLTLDDDGEFFCRVVLASRGVYYSACAINHYRKFRYQTNLSASGTRKAMLSLQQATNLKYEQLKKKDHPKLNIALAKLYIENAVTFFPEHFDLYKAAMSKVKLLGPINYVPVIGGNKIEYIKKILGWRFAKALQYIFNRLKTLIARRRYFV
ncbi:MAG TPA: glycosyltransferase family A protein [Mucilaginibacter sp.]|nr:glycosyltransferase family A protein [Mucilaginibacter sp.]